jgi:carbonic anhydrase/acetyltransferase-like protein (isoleucine patch superfamily)
MVKMKEFSSVWPNCTVRGDVNRIEIGRYSNIQDNSCLHVADRYACIVGDYVTVGHCATLHACTIEDHVLIGMSATVLTGAHIGRGSIIAAGAVVKENDVIPPGSLVVGVPGKVVRTQDRIETIHAQAIKYKCEWAIEYGVYPEIGGEKYHGEQII